MVRAASSRVSSTGRSEAEMTRRFASATAFGSERRTWSSTPASALSASSRPGYEDVGEAVPERVAAVEDGAGCDQPPGPAFAHRLSPT